MVPGPPRHRQPWRGLRPGPGPFSSGLPHAARPLITCQPGSSIPPATPSPSLGHGTQAVPVITSHLPPPQKMGNNSYLRKKSGLARERGFTLHTYQY